MPNFFAPVIKETSEGVYQEYARMRLQVFIGIFVGYAGYYLVRKNFALVMPDLAAQGYSKADLGLALSGVSIAYGFSKFIMGYVSDRSNARYFLPIGLVLSASVMIFMGLSSWATSSIFIMFCLLLLNGWFQGMGWPPCGRVLAHWFSRHERGTKMSVWNVSHNVGGGLIGPMAIFGVMLFGTWHSKFYFSGMAALFLALIAFLLIRDSPESLGWPPVEDYKKDHNNPYHADTEDKLSTWGAFSKYILRNRLLWYISFANAFIYLVRYGVLDWSPTYLEEVKHYSLSASGWAYFTYEYAGIPGTLICGWLSDKVFRGRRAPATIIYMFFVLAAILVYWKNPPGHIWVDQMALVTIGFFIYGPVMLIGVFALDLVPKNAAGTAAGLTGLFGYLGGAVFANIAMGYVLDHWQWNGGFMVLIAACIFSVLFTLPAWKREAASR